jgi:uncharacterized protein
MRHLISLLCGLMFGEGLILSGMYRPEVVIYGLKLGSSDFNPALIITFIVALSTTFILYQFRRILKKPIASEQYNMPSRTELDWYLIVGSILFGVGWGVTGICPGPNVVGLALFSYSFYWVNFLGIVVGFMCARYFFVKKAKS